MFSPNLVEIIKTVPSAVVVEIGVARGETAAKILSCENVVFYYGVDPYELYEKAPTNRYECGYLDLKMVKVPVSDGTMESLKKDCLENLKVYKGRYKLIEKYSHEALDDVPVAIDVLYIDGNHQYEYVMDDLKLWYPKVRSGGLVLGDDYNFSGGPVTNGFGGKIACEVDRACEDFCKQQNLTYDVVDGNFLIVKP